MLSLTVVSRSQYIQWAAIAVWVFFWQDCFNAEVFPYSAKPQGMAAELQKYCIGLYSVCHVLDYAAIAQFNSVASQRKAIQYTLFGYIVLAAYFVYEGTVEANLRVVVWAFANLLFLLVAIYVWHKDEKNDGARPDSKLQLAIRIHYVVWIAGLLAEVTGYGAEMIKDPSSFEGESFAQLRLGAVLRLFSVMGSFAVAQINADDQKKAVQYKMGTILLGLIKVTFWSIELNPKYFDYSIGLMAILLQTMAWLTYGGSCQKSVIRLFYTVLLFLGFIGLLNPDLFIKQFFPHTPMSTEAGLNIAALHVALGLAFVAVSQLDAEAHRKLLQYGIAANALSAGVIRSSQNMWTCQSVCHVVWALIFTCVVYPKELGLSNCPLCPSALMNRLTCGGAEQPQARSRSSSPKRATGRSATPGKKSANKKGKKN